MNSVQFTKVVKSSIYKKVTKSLENSLVSTDINKVLLLIYANKSLKVSPFTFAEFKEKYLSDCNKEAMVFSKTLGMLTSGIEKNFNKNRKISRIFKDIYTNHKDSLLKDILSEDVLQSLVKVYFIDRDILNKIGLDDKCEYGELLNSKYVIELLQKYLVCLVATDLLLSSKYAEELVILSITSDNYLFLDSMYDLVNMLLD